MIKIREGVISDSKEIAMVHVNCWKTTYKGIMPNSILDSLSYEKSEKRWIKYFNDKNDKSTILVAVNENNKIIGFCTGVKNRETDLRHKYKGELATIYIEEKYQNQGIGKRLTLNLAQDLIKKDMTSKKEQIKRIL